MTESQMMSSDCLAARPSAVRANPVARAVCEGLSASTKHLPAWLFYDREGSRLFELITELPEYYLTRAERSIFEERADEIIGTSLELGHSRGLATSLDVMELGAGTATKSQILLAAALERLGRCLFAPVDVSGAALDIASARLAIELPQLLVKPILGDHQKACLELSKLSPRRLVLFIGSSMGNFVDAENIALFSGVRGALDTGDAFLIGADRPKDPHKLIAAYDDAQGVTAAFNKNMLTRINRELDAHFDVDKFRHVARWNAVASRVEMHLESVCDQQVSMGVLDASVRFEKGETIHTESSVKYSDERIRSIVSRAGFRLERTFFDREERFGAHLCRAI